MYHYDSIGSKERIKATCTGKGQLLIQSFLDEMTAAEKRADLWNFSFNNSEFSSPLSEDTYCKLNKDEAISLVIQAFKAAGERDITVGDGLEIIIASKDSDKHHICIERQFKLLPTH